MKHALSGLGILILVLLMVACPAHAFTAKSLDITIQDSTDAIITFDYELSWFESIAVFSRIADPSAELVKALKSEFNKNVEVISVTGNHVQLWVQNYATRKENDGTATLNAPALSFRNAEKALNNYWFAPLISPDFSPEITRVSFPDGYSEEFYNQDQIPSLSHSMGTTS